MEQSYWTVGPYDMVAIFEAPDDQAVTAQLLEICSAGTLGPPRFAPTTVKRCRGSLRGLAERRRSYAKRKEGERTG
ncbi:MAG: GYD domain-containing protein [Chloroflexota bacterium]|nr:GYD domain-containing protein [Chloroflexota bacterium]